MKSEKTRENDLLVRDEVNKFDLRSNSSFFTSYKKEKKAQKLFS